MAKVVSFVNIKGGTGKTTLTTNLAVTLAKKKKNVCVLDLDTQGSTESFLIDYEGNLPALTHKHIPLSAFGSLSKIIKEYSEKNDYVLMDVGGGDITSIQSILPFTDNLIIPARPSKKDISTTSALIVSMSKRGDFVANPQLQAVIVMNQCSFHPMSTTAEECADSFNQIIELVNLSDRIQVLKKRLHIATAWIEADIECSTIDEMGKCKAADQWKQLVAEFSKKGVI